jgi:hypothetical protein
VKLLSEQLKLYALGAELPKAAEIYDTDKVFDS